ncbi:spore germination protein KC [Fontibacillus phaseoli]|uniref:Spore germination protein KC n=1 Tax=Fontibacillus phaseoli TaxID=1416533 RepID=A0A369BS50_9BACL|nr:Ger(x)C family spore germination protein [Fontibacillus phaseoli]RCX23426.1 spore germination protein KC [Fontibacillus phaseoli]
MNAIKRACLRSITAIILMTSIGGCWSSEEINNRAFVTMMIVDKMEDGQIELTLGFPLPNRMIPGQAGGGGGTSGDPYSFVSKKAETISEALELIQVDNSRRISFGQTQVIVIGRRFAEQGIDPLLEFAARQPAFHISSNIFVTPNKATEITKTPLVFERFLSDILSKYISQSQTLDTTVKDFLVAKYKGGDILLPLLSFTIKPEIGATDPKKNRWLGSDGAAIMSNGKMSDIVMTTEELRGALWLSSQLKTSVINVKSPTDGGIISAVAQDIGTSIKPVVRNGKVSFKVNSHAGAFILSSLSDIDLKKPDNLLRLQEVFEKNIAERMNRVLEKTRRAKSDAFLMSQYLDWRYPKMWGRMKEDWREYYATELPIDISVSITIKRTGVVFRSTKQEESRD